MANATVHRNQKSTHTPPQTALLVISYVAGVSFGISTTVRLDFAGRLRDCICISKFFRGAICFFVYHIFFFCHAW